MPIAVSMDGQLVPPDAARVSVFDRGFLYGDSVFETLRTYGGKPYALDRHLGRLAESAARVFIPLPVPMDRLAREIEATLGAGENAESYVRVMLTRGQGELGLDPALSDRALRVVLVAPLVGLPAASYERGVGAVLFRTQRAADATAAHGAKIGNYLVAVLAVREARAAGAHEALIVDVAGRVVEGATSNVFIVQRGALVTPPESAGILLGITRERVLDLARGVGLAVREHELSVDDVLGADELFITSTLREVLPVVRVGDRAIGGGEPGVVTRRVAGLLSAAVRSH